MPVSSARHRGPSPAFSRMRFRYRVVCSCPPLPSIGSYRRPWTGLFRPHQELRRQRCSASHHHVSERIDDHAAIRAAIVVLCDEQLLGGPSWRGYRRLLCPVWATTHPGPGMLSAGFCPRLDVLLCPWRLSIQLHDSVQLYDHEPRDDTARVHLLSKVRGLAVRPVTPTENARMG